MEDFEEIRSPDIPTSKEEENTQDSFINTGSSVPEPFEEVPAPPAPTGRETTPVFPLKQALLSASLDPSRMYELQDRRAAKTTTGSFTVKHEELFYNVMAVGGSGLGKTTLLRNLFQGYAGQVQLPTPGRRSYATIDDFIRSPDTFVWAPFRVIDERTCKSVQVKVVDVPGHGFEVDMPHKDYTRKLLAFVLQQKAKDYETYTSRVFQADITGKLRNTLSVCLYFLSPFTMRPLDVVLMAALSKEVPVIPVIAMSDTMSPAKRQEYSQHIMSQLLSPKRLLPNWSGDGPVEVTQLTKEDKEKLGVDEGRVLPPFAVMGSEDLAAEEEDNTGYCPVIHTMAGSLEVMNRHFCDTILLKRFLMGDSCDGFWNILSAATNRYLSFCERVETMTEKRMDRKLAKLAEEISFLCQFGEADFSPAPSATLRPSVSIPLSPSTPAPTVKRLVAAVSSTSTSSSHPHSPKRSASHGVWAGLRPVFHLALLLLLVFGAFMAGTHHAVVPDTQHKPVSSSIASGLNSVPELGDGSWTGLKLLGSLSSGVLERAADQEALTMADSATEAAGQGKARGTCTGASAASDIPPASSALTPTPASAIPSKKSKPAVVGQSHESVTTNTTNNARVPLTSSNGDNFFSSLSSTLSSTAQLPGQDSVKAWTQDALDWVTKVGQKRPRVVRRSRVLASKAVAAVMKQLEVAAQKLKCKVGGQAGGEECSQ